MGFSVNILTFLLLLLSSSSTVNYASAVSAQGVEVDVTAAVYKVIDGDTLDAFSVGRVRLADIDAPELGEPRKEAKDALTAIASKKKAYLDVDDLYVMDKYNRLIAIVYVRHNETHLLNVNLFLVIEKHAVIKDFDNEFNPKTWMLYVKYAEVDYKALYEELLGNYTKLKSDYEALSGEHARLLKEYGELRKRFDELRSAYDGLFKEHDRLKAAYEDLTGKYSRLKAAYEELSKVVTNLT